MHVIVNSSINFDGDNLMYNNSAGGQGGKKRLEVHPLVTKAFHDMNSGTTVRVSSCKLLRCVAVRIIAEFDEHTLHVGADFDFGLS